MEQRLWALKMNNTFNDILRDVPSSAIEVCLMVWLIWMTEESLEQMVQSYQMMLVGGLLFWRMLGFYPYSVSLFKMISFVCPNRTNAYVQDLKAHYRQAYVKARIR